MSVTVYVSGTCVSGTADDVNQVLVDRINAGCLESADAILRLNENLIFRIAMRYTNIDVRDHHWPDIMQEARMGVLRAVKTYEPRTKFMTYASYWIQQKVKQVLCRLHSARIPQHANWAYFKIEEQRDYLIGETLEDTAMRIGSTDSDLIAAQLAERIRAKEYKLDMHDLKTPPAFLITSCANQSMEDQEELEHCLRILSSHDKRLCYIIHEFFGIGCHEKRTLKDIGIELGISKERTRQLKDKALEIMRSSRK